MQIVCFNPTLSGPLVSKTRFIFPQDMASIPKYAFMEG
jgi:hypothetical protein